MKVGPALFVVLVFLPLFSLFPQSSIPITIQAERASQSITVDGFLEERAWKRPGFSSFMQREPNQGEAGTEKTEVWVAYDDAALYVAARMYDSAPDSIMRVLGRRDAFTTADWFTFFIDPYYDRRTGFFFSVSAAGTKGDGTMYNDDWDDSSWDGVWEGEVNIDREGWSVEMRIPYSQLRFHQMPKYLWGVNFKRDIGRKNERSYVVYTPRNESGFVSRFVDLVGIDNVVPARQVEILPYLNTRAEYLQHKANDPFNNGSRILPGLGADMKVGLGSNLTLNATVNPDFGQVEVDPAVVNLSDVETFFQEKRPFFIESSSTFEFGYGGSNSFWGFNWSNPNLFYSRRIGRSPQGGLPSHDYAELPVGTHILGAAKVTGRVGEGWNIGTIHAVTQREFGKIDLGGQRSNVEVEPLTYYGVARAQKEFNNGMQALGFISGLTKRSFDDNRLRDQLNSDALVGGIDGWAFLDSNKTYVLTGWTSFSHVAGTPARMVALQRNSAHYFQRPDATHLRVDSSATSLTGFAGRLMLNKQKGQVMLNAAIGFVDPNMDPNDLGFLGRTDVINGHLVTGYKWTDPTDYYRSVQLRFSTFGNLDFEGNKIWHGYFHNGFLELPNYYSIYWGAAYNPETISNRRTRGGPLTLTPAGRELWIGVDSDSRKSLVLSLWVSSYARKDEPSVYLESSLQWKPAPNVTLSAGPSYSVSTALAQWVGVFDDPTATATYGRRYVFATFDQTSLSANIRLNWTFTPALSLQLFLQPLISSGEYRDFKELIRPKSYDFRVYGTEGSTFDAATHRADPDGSGPARAISIGNPDFNFKSLRGNAVLRWEYRPGSTLYLVWTQSRSDFENTGEFRFNSSMSRLWEAKPDNILMLKFTYWWSI
ncbi:MAG: DUF5916 domain-containing protein [Bacteroidota bacterium]